MKTINVNDYDFNYVDVGEGEPVVFVHGTVGDYRTWEAQMDDFSKKYRVIAYSRRFAHPNNQVVDDSADYSVRAHTIDLSQFLKALNIGPVHLVGHSYGALTALVTTLENPELVRSLTLGEGPVMSLLQNIPNGENLLGEFASTVFTPTAEAFQNNDERKAVEIFIGGVLADSLYFSKAPAQQKEVMLANTVELKAVVTRENLFPELSCDEIRKIKAPVLLIKGVRSPHLLTLLTDELNRCLDNGQIVELPNSSHGLEYENPEEFNRIVLDFINKH